MRKLRKKIVIIGGGFGGLNTAKELGSDDFDITLVDKTNHHLFQPLLYQVATAALSPADIGTPIRKIVRNQDNILVLMSEVTDIDTNNKKIELHNHAPISYDILIVATGASHSYFGHDEWKEYAPGLKTLDDALGLRDKILSNFELAELCVSFTEPEKYLSFVIIGGGPTGVELAGAIAEIANHAMIENFKRIEPANTKVYLIEGLKKILPSMPEKLSERARRDLEELGVEVITGEMVTNINKEGVEIGSRFITSTNVIWAAGNEASPLLKKLGVPTDRMGRVIVAPDLTIPDHSEVFVIGDASNCKVANGNPLPSVAPVAIQQAAYVSKIIKQGKVGKDNKPFVYNDQGTMATIGRSRAVVKIGGIEFGGFLAWCAWSVLHLMYIILYRNRLKVLVDWVYGYLTGQRGARLIRKPSQKIKKE